LQENLKIGDPAKAAEVFIDMLSSPGTWERLSEPAKEIVVGEHLLGVGGQRPPDQHVRRRQEV
jgi:hypothetical protein